MPSWVLKSGKHKSSGASDNSIEEQSLALQSPTDGPYGLQLLHEPAEGIDVAANIVLIHGLTGNRLTTWTKNPNKKNECFWPQELLPTTIPNIRILTWGYDADVIRKTPMAVVSSNTLEEHAEALCSDLAALQASVDKKCPIIFIAHSLGGLVCKKALLQATEAQTKENAHIKAVADQTRGIMFLGTPHRTSSQASWGTMLAAMFGIFNQVNASLDKGLYQEGKKLDLLQKRFINLLSMRREAGSNIEISFFFEELPSPTIGTIVPLESATFSNYTRIGIHASHSDMTKYSGNDSNGYIRITGELTRWLSKLHKESQEHAASQVAKEKGQEKGNGSSGVTNYGGMHHHGNNAKGANAFYGGTFGNGTQIGTIKNYSSKDDSSDEE